MDTAIIKDGAAPASTGLLGPVAAGGQRYRPQQFLLAFLGSMVVDRHEEPLQSRVFIDLLGEIGISDTATRAALARMVRAGLLARWQNGRNAAFTLTDRSRQVLRRAEGRVLSQTPFTHADGTWTLLSFSVPEARRDVRHQLRTRLGWAGFAPLRDGLWIAPGTVDLNDVLAGLVLPDGSENNADAFLAQPLPPSQAGSFIGRVWNLAELRKEHERFLGRWDRPIGTVPTAIAQLTMLIADWLRLLRADPGLPREHLPGDWPAERSVATFYLLHGRLEAAATASFPRFVAGE